MKKIAIEILAMQEKALLLKMDPFIYKYHLTSKYVNDTDPDLTKAAFEKYFNKELSEDALGSLALKIILKQVKKRFVLPLLKQQVATFAEATETYSAEEIPAFYLSLTYKS